MTVTMTQFQTENLKLAALILAETPSSTFKIGKSGSDLKLITIFHPEEHITGRDNLINMYAAKKARCDVFRYNRALNDLRDALREAIPCSL